MPILEIEIIRKPGEVLAPNLASTLSERASEVLGAQPGGTWVKLRFSESALYAEDGGGPPPGVHPVFVRVLKAELPPPVELAAEVEQLTQAIAEACERRPRYVHILYEPPARGRIAFGGRLL